MDHKCRQKQILVWGFTQSVLDLSPQMVDPLIPSKTRACDLFVNHSHKQFIVLHPSKVPIRHILPERMSELLSRSSPPCANTVPISMINSLSMDLSSGQAGATSHHHPLLDVLREGKQKIWLKVTTRGSGKKKHKLTFSLQSDPSKVKVIQSSSPPASVPCARSCLMRRCANVFNDHSN